jgi:hypothetical protein
MLKVLTIPVPKAIELRFRTLSLGLTGQPENLTL